MQLEVGVACIAHIEALQSLHMQTDKKTCHASNPGSQVCGREDDFLAKVYPRVAQEVLQIEIRGQEIVLHGLREIRLSSHTEHVNKTPCLIPY